MSGACGDEDIQYLFLWPHKVVVVMAYLYSSGGGVVSSIMMLLFLFCCVLLYLSHRCYIILFTYNTY